MADLTPLDEKIGEVLGLAQAAYDATEKVASLAEDGETKQGARAHALRRDRDARALRGRAGPVRGQEDRDPGEGPRDRGQATKMMQTYLSGDDVDALDGFEFLVMAEAGELGHREIVREMNEQVGDQTVAALAEFAIPIQPRHFETARERSLALAREEVASG